MSAGKKAGIIIGCIIVVIVVIVIAMHESLLSPLGPGVLPVSGSYVLSEASTSSNGWFQEWDIGEIYVDLENNGTLCLRLTDGGVSYLGEWTLNGNTIQLQTEIWGSPMVRVGIVSEDTISLGDGSIWRKGTSSAENDRLTTSGTNDTLREVVIKVNYVQFHMEYFVNMLDVYTTGVNSTELYYYGSYFAGMTADTIIRAESLRQAAGEELDIELTADAISTELEDRGLPDDKIYRDLIRATLLEEKVGEHFDAGANATMEQAHTEVMLLESQEVADEVMAEIKAGGNFTALTQEFSCSSSVEGDLGWLPEELMPNTSIASAAFSLASGNVSQPIYDATAVKDESLQTTSGYWIVKVIDRGDRQIDEQTREALKNKRYNDWLEAWEENGTVQNLLDADKNAWAIDEVFKRRNA